MRVFLLHVEQFILHQGSINYVSGFAFRKCWTQAQRSQENTYSSRSPWSLHYNEYSTQGILNERKFCIYSHSHGENKVDICSRGIQTGAGLGSWSAVKGIGDKGTFQPLVSLTSFCCLIQLIKTIISFKSISIYWHLCQSLYDGRRTPVLVIWNFIELIPYIAHNKVSVQ